MKIDNEQKHGCSTNVEMELFLNWMHKDLPILYSIIQILINRAVAVNSLSEMILSNDIHSTLSVYHNDGYYPPAYYNPQNKTIVVNAKQPYTEILTYLIFEIYNALNKDLKKIEFKNFKDADEYAMQVEKIEFGFTDRPSTKLIYQYLIDHESEAKIFFSTDKLYLAYLDIYKASNEISFEENLENNKARTEAYRQQYINYYSSIGATDCLAPILGDTKDVNLEN